jgi:hypothetical protein
MRGGKERLIEMLRILLTSDKLSLLKARTLKYRPLIRIFPCAFGWLSTKSTYYPSRVIILTAGDRVAGGEEEVEMEKYPNIVGIYCWFMV